MTGPFYMKKGCSGKEGQIKTWYSKVGGGGGGDGEDQKTVTKWVLGKLRPQKKSGPRLSRKLRPHNISIF